MQNTTTATSERLRVLVLDDYERLADQVPAFAQLKARAEVTVMNTRLETNDELGQALRGIHAILLMRERTRFKEDRLSLAPALKLISQTGKTSRHLDLPAATRRGVAIAFTPSDSGISTVELTWGLILSLMRRIPEVDRRMRQEAWPPVPGHLIEGKTIGVVGLGRIGREVARIARAFRARVLATGRTLTEERAREAGAEAVSLETLLRESDIVTIHVPLRPETRGLIGEKEIALMKRGAVLVNTARGPIVSQGALFEALQRGHLGGAGLDVYDEEPLPMDHPLRRLDNAVLLSHRGYATEEILRARYQNAMENILNFFDGKPVQLLNPEALTQTKKIV
ncbi:MAG: D-2-hydroxyacid dehydrogenase family protein [Deltaproteobacteria bacterium]|nr:D-2-hydroxyacid dehydrogenase family protein [Deltaproteobacteria bacterium]